jgi:hypothetical protein
MQGPVSKDAAQGAFSAPVAGRRNSHHAGNIVFVVVDVKTERAREVILHQLTEPRLAMDDTLRCADDVIAVRKEAGEIRWRIRDHIENVPDRFGDGKRGPLQSDAERRRRVRDGDR